MYQPFRTRTKALSLEAAWKADCYTTKLNSYHPNYQQTYEAFVLAKSSSSSYNGYFKAKQPFYNAVALAHNLQSLQIFDRLKAWSNKYVDFLNTDYNPQSCIAQMHAMTVIIQTSQKRFVSKSKIATMVFEALKSCVTWPSGHRLCNVSFICQL